MSKEASNQQVEILKDDPKKALIRIAIPMIFSLLMVSFNNIIDRIWISGLGSDPLAAIGFVTPLFMVIIGIGHGIGSGSNSLISRFIGAEDYENASNSALHGIIIGAIVSILIMLCILPFINNILLIMGAKAVMGYAFDYAFILICGTFTFIYNMLFASQLRAEGDVKRSTIVMVSCDVLNIILDPIFIYLLGWGISGAALATVISTFIPTVLAVYWLFVKNDTYLNYSLSNFIYDSSLIRGVLEVGIPASIEELIMSFVSIFLNAILSMVAGTSIIAAFTVSFTLLQIGMMPGLAIGTGALTVTGVAYGAKNYENLTITTHYALKVNIAISVAICVFLYIFAPQVALIFTYSEVSAGLYPILTHVLRILTFFILVAPIGAICASVFQAMGKGTISLLLTVVREFLFVIVFTYTAGIILNWGSDAILISFVLAVGLGSLISYLAVEYWIKKLKRIG
ncbi:MAG: MATE family efflux transporter [Methanosphaera sp. rholeuAM74]|nr:MAG: MATE family efflux transporter [Methanosphaera sp. rholeuAM74]